MTFSGEKLRQIRLSRGRTVRDLPVAHDTISRIERGQRTPHPSTLRKLATALDCEVSDFFEGPEAPKGQPPPPRREGRPRGRRDWGAEVKAFVSGASEVIDAPDLAETTCLDISKAAGELFLQVWDARDKARNDPDCSWKERNELNLAYERISEFSTKTVDTFKERFRQPTRAKEFEEQRKEWREQVERREKKTA